MASSSGMVMAAFADHHRPGSISSASFQGDAEMTVGHGSCASTSSSFPFALPRCRAMLRVIPYHIIASSGHSASYRPENIKDDRPTDQASRWSSTASDQAQFITLQLDQLAILQTITFGKFHKVHVCNLKEFKVFAGPTLDTLMPVLHTGLRNDSEPETFPIATPPGLTSLPAIPVRFVKIVPLAAWGSNFNYSIWFVEMRGITDTDGNGHTKPPSSIMTTAIMASNAGTPGKRASASSSRSLAISSSSHSTTTTAVTSLSSCHHQHPQQHNLTKLLLAAFNAEREQNAWRLCLKHLRERNVRPIFEALQKQVGLSLEDVALADLHDAIVERGDFAGAEKYLLDMVAQKPNLFDEFLETKVPHRAFWQRIDCFRGPNDDQHGSNSGFASPQANSSMPSMRGGHQMVWDSANRCIYLFGGWDGTKDLSDFWLYSVENEAWTCLSNDTRGENGPSPRSCHKLALHSSQQQLYVLGRYVDPDTRTSTSLLSEFYVYDLQHHTWKLLSNDTRADGGPGLIYDHQMVMDETNNVLYVFGGRSIVAGPTEPSYSGLYAYSVNTEQWRLIRSDTEFPEGSPHMRSRIGHSMLFNPRTRQLYIYAGQRNKDYYSDFYVYDVDSDTITEMVRDTARVGGPEPGFTQRGTLDVDRGELFFFSGLMREGSSNSSSSHNSNTAQGNNSAVGNSSVTTASSAASGGNASVSMSASIDATLSSSSQQYHGSSSSSAAGESARNNFWLYSIPRRTWTRLQIGINNASTPSSSNNGGLAKDNRHQQHGATGATAGMSSASPQQMPAVYANATTEPCPRFAHQLVYDPETRTHYLFGGNPGDSAHPRLRLNDFWKLSLRRPSDQNDILRKARFLLRRQQFREMCAAVASNASSSPAAGSDSGSVNSNSAAVGPASLDALKFLQQNMAQVVQHSDPVEGRQFRELSTWLFQPPDQSAMSNGDAAMRANESIITTATANSSRTAPSAMAASYNGGNADAISMAATTSASLDAAPFHVHSRQQLYAELLTLFPLSMRPPAANLVDLASSVDALLAAPHHGQSSAIITLSGKR